MRRLGQSNLALRSRGAITKPGRRNKLMQRNWTEILTGGLVLIAAVVFTILSFQRAGFSGTSESYELTASFRSVEGVSIGTDVRMAGVKIGSVKDITLNPLSFRADLTVILSRQLEIPDDSAIIIASEGLLGGTFVEIQPGGSPFIMEAGDEFNDTQGAVSLLNLLLRYVSGSGDQT